VPNGVVFTDRDDRKRRETTLLCVLGVRYNFGTTEGEKEWVSGSKATPNEALGFFDSVVGIQVLSITTVSKHPLCQRLRFGLPISARNRMVGKH
jgi:hypothetical protein